MNWESIFLYNINNSSLINEWFIALSIKQKIYITDFKYIKDWIIYELKEDSKFYKVSKRTTRNILKLVSIIWKTFIMILLWNNYLTIAIE